MLLSMCGKLTVEKLKVTKHTIQDFNVKIQVGITVMTLCMLPVHISCMGVLYISITHSSVEVTYPDTLRPEGVQMFT